MWPVDRGTTIAPAHGILRGEAHVLAGPADQGGVGVLLTRVVPPIPVRGADGSWRTRLADERMLAALPAVILALVSVVLIAGPAPAPPAPAALAVPPRAVDPVAAALQDPFSQVTINAGLRALRTEVERSEQVRSLAVLSDGTLSATVVRGEVFAYVMARGTQVAREQIYDRPAGTARLDLDRVHGLAITRFREAAQAAFGMDAAQFTALRLAPTESGSSRFAWTGSWGSAKLYADREGRSITRALHG